MANQRSFPGILPGQRALSSARKRIGTAAELLVERLNRDCAQLGVAILYPGDSGLRPVGPVRPDGTIPCRARCKGTVDFTGTLRGGRAVFLEVKHTELPSWPLDNLADHQAAILADQHRLGSLCLVVIVGPGPHPGRERVSLIPWPVMAAAREAWRAGGRASLPAETLIAHSWDEKAPYLAGWLT